MPHPAVITANITVIKNTANFFIESLLYLIIQECLSILAARCTSCNCMTYFYCAPLQSCRRLYQLGD
ncbi:hypothetical protein DXB97_11955 [Firmicutes bacterium OM07-11]|nr:hypothetical protein DXB97_11955 [Firmicutes bacterium OM07-11]